jgi:transposase
MQTITTIGLDITKSIFQVHGVDAAGQVVIRRQLKRRYVLAFFQKLPPCLIGIEACASSHYWSRELQAPGHTVRMMPPAYVKPYVKRQKNDATDAEAICEALARANMRFVPTKTPETAQPQGADRGVRSGLARLQRNEQAPSLHSRSRSDAGNRSGR